MLKAPKRGGATEDNVSALSSLIANAHNCFYTGKRWLIENNSEPMGGGPHRPPPFESATGWVIPLRSRLGFWGSSPSGVVGRAPPEIKFDSFLTSKSGC